MNKYKLIIILLIGTVSGILPCNCTKENEEEFPANVPFPQIDLSASGQIPILAWYSVYGFETTLKNYQDIKDAGFTHNLSFPRGENDIARSFEYARQVGLKILLYVDRSWTSEEEVTERVNRYKDHPALFGYYVYDEPSPGQFSEVAEAVKFVQNLDRQHPCYVPFFRPLSRFRKRRRFPSPLFASGMVRKFGNYCRCFPTIRKAVLGFRISYGTPYK